MEKKLYRSRKERMLSGVCGGLGKYFSVDPTFVRLAFILLCFVGFSGVLAYIVAAIIIPEIPENMPEENVETYDADGNKVNVEAQKKTKQFLGVFFIIIGAFLLVDKIFYWISFDVFLGVGIVLVGIYLLLGNSIFKPKN